MNLQLCSRESLQLCYTPQVLQTTSSLSRLQPGFPPHTYHPTLFSPPSHYLLSTTPSPLVPNIINLSHCKHSTPQHFSPPHSPQKLGTPSSGHICHPSKLQACVSVPERAEKSHRKGLNLHTLHLGNRPRTGAHFESLQQSTNPYKDCPCPTATNDFLSRMWSSEQTPLRGARLSPRRASAYRGGGRSPYHH